MKPVEYLDRTLTCDGVALADIAAKAGTPCYVYSAATILANYRAYDDTLAGRSAHHMLRDEGQRQPGDPAPAGPARAPDSTSSPEASCIAF